MPQRSEDASSRPYSLTEDILRKRAKGYHYGRFSTQLYAGILACLSSMSFGTAVGWSGPVTHYLFKDKQIKEFINSQSFSLLVSMVPLGCCLGIGSSSFLLKQLGPKRAQMFAAPFYISVWWTMLLPSIKAQVAGRFFLGFLGILFSINGEVLLQHTVHQAIRRYISVFHSSAMLVGVFLSNIWGNMTNKFWLTIICGSLPVLHLLLLLPAPESPVFLYASSAMAAAKSLAWYRGEGNFTMEMNEIKKDWDVSRQDSEAYGYMMFHKVVYKGLLIVVVITFFQVSSGYYIFLFYSIHVWTNGHIIYSSLTDSAIVAGLFVCTRTFWGTLHNMFSWKLKRLLIASSLMISIELSILSGFLFLDQWHLHIPIDVYWLPLMILMVFLFFFDMGLNFYPKILIFEYMPFQVFRKCYTIVQIFFWLFCFLNVFSFAMVRMLFPPYLTFFILALMSYMGTLFCYFFVVEPKGKSLLQIQLELGGNPIGRRGIVYNQTKMVV